MVLSRQMVAGMGEPGGGILIGDRVDGRTYGLL